MRLNRKRGVLVGVLILAVLCIGWTVVSMTAEHPGYVNAAKGLESARREAEKRFGTTVHDHAPASESDNAAWSAISDSIPGDVDAAVRATTSLPDYMAVFSKNRSWYVALLSRVEPLQTRFTDQTDISDSTAGLADGGMVTGFQGLSIVKNIGKACQVGIIGAADAGDAKAVESIGRTGAQLVDKLLIDADSIQVLVADAVKAIVTRGVLMAMARNPSNAEVRRAAIAALYSMPQQTPTYTMFAMRSVSTAEYFPLLRQSKADELDANIDEISESCPIKVGRLEKWVRSFMLTTIARKKAVGNPHNVGPHTIDALEARYWETAVEIYDAARSAGDDPRQTRANVEAVYAKLKSKKDRSYELASPHSPALLLQNRQRVKLSIQSTLASALLIDRFPNPSDLPETLPPDLVFTDPFTGNPVQYLRLSDGFIIHSLGEDKKQDKPTYAHPANFVSRAQFRKLGDDDWGFAVSYAMR